MIELLKIATEQRPKTISEKVILLNRLILSINKIIASFQSAATNPQAPQEVHMQVMENIFYQAPHLFDNALMQKFFEIKNELDAGILLLPLSDKHEPIFSDLLKSVTRKLKHLRLRLYVLQFLYWILAIVVLISFTPTVKSKWAELTAPTESQSLLKDGSK